MKRKLTRLSRRYQAALREHLQQGPRASLLPARRLGRRAVALGLETLDLARIHEGALATLRSSRGRDPDLKRAELFFVEAITPIEKTHRAALQACARLSRLSQQLGRRTADLATSNQSLKHGIARRQTVEQAFKKSAGHYGRLMTKSRRLQQHLRQLTHQRLSAQEAGRQQISRELHDEVAQNLLGIHVRLLTLKQEAGVDPQELKKAIASTQRLVKKSVKILNRFARELGKPHMG